MLDHFIYWLGTAPSWQLAVAALLAVLAATLWVKCVDSLTDIKNNHYTNFTKRLEFAYRRPLQEEIVFVV